MSKTRNPFSTFCSFLQFCFLLAALLFTFLAPSSASAGEIKKVVVPFTIDANTTTSLERSITTSGTIKLARLKAPSGYNANTTLTISAWCGDTIGSVLLSSTTTSTTGTTTISVTTPLDGESRLQLTVTGTTGAARTFYLVLMVEE